MVECGCNIPRTREVCGRDPEEILYDGLQGHDHTYGIKLEAIDLFLDVPDEYETKYLLCCEHIETCSPNGCKACSEVPEGYS